MNRARIASARSQRYRVPRLAKIEIEQSTRTVSIEGSGFRLSPLEFRLAEMLYFSGQKPVPYDEIETALWGSSDPSTRQALRQLVKRLRSRLHEWSNAISNAPGVGYTIRIQEK
jgi:DNA-binding response OmpR family regulator